MCQNAHDADADAEDGKDADGKERKPVVKPVLFPAKKNGGGGASFSEIVPSGNVSMNARAEALTKRLLATEIRQRNSANAGDRQQNPIGCAWKHH